MRSRATPPSSKYQEKDELRLSDFIEHLRFVRGELHFDADYNRGRRLKTRIVVRSNGTMTLGTIGRGKSVDVCGRSAGHECKTANAVRPDDHSIGSEGQIAAEVRRASREVDDGIARRNPHACHLTVPWTLSGLGTALLRGL